MNEVVVFLGPSLPAAEARAILDCDVRPPARQGDVFRALIERPKLIVLLDGVFEASPSVWHHELVAAHAAGVLVIGASSMGALRAAELSSVGVMRGVGAVFRAYQTGELIDDGEVALLHASAEHGFRPLTVPLVNVRRAAQAGQRGRVLTRAEAFALVEAGKALHYQSRSWPKLLKSVDWKPATHEKWRRFAEAGLPDVKADDARLALKAAKTALTRVRRMAAVPKPLPSHVRRRRLHEDLSLGVAGARISDEAGNELAKEGLRRLLLAFWARELGLRISRKERADAEQRWLAELDVKDRDAFLSASGLDESQLQSFVEELALDEKATQRALWLASDAPAEDEAVAFEARRRGLWAELARRLSPRR